MRRARLALLLALLAPACGDPAAGEPDAAPPGPETFTHEFPEVTIAPGEEKIGLCQSWTIGNTAPMYVHTVEIFAGPGWHHSNWIWVDDDDYVGPDGVWPCAEREFDELTGGLRGGVLTAQSTQSMHDVQAFPPGHVMVLPERARIVGATHALNIGDAPVTSHLGLAIHTIPKAQVTQILHPLHLQNRSLVLQPMARSRQTIRCDYDMLHQAGTGRPLDMKIYFVLPHYHELGTGLTLRAVGGAKDGEIIFESAALTGEPGGGTLSTAYDLSGATGLAMTCHFDNPRAEEVRWGIGDQEMCVLLAFTDSELVWAGGAQDLDTNVVLGQDQDGVWDNEAPCKPYGFIPAD